MSNTYKWINIIFFNYTIIAIYKFIVLLPYNFVSYALFIPGLNPFTEFTSTTFNAIKKFRFFFIELSWQWNWASFMRQKRVFIVFCLKTLRIKRIWLVKIVIHSFYRFMWIQIIEFTALSLPKTAHKK